ncbi:MAG: shikimate dehydrogenase [Limnohabitans sp.]|jgi:shikimate dehydrogenase|nr:shikimate dehydrogenase [Limnohabitans sp.]
MASEPQKFKLAGIMGMPVLQSRSPAIYNHWIREHGVLGAYGHLPVRIEQVETALRGLAALGMVGCNITLPHKLEALKIIDSVHPMARQIGAVNCIVVQEDGSLHGMNTDWVGYLGSIKEVQPGWRADQGPIAVLGSGGAARAILYALVSEGAREIRLVNRTRAKADELAADFPGIVQVHDWSQRHDVLAGCAMLINTTNQGMYGQPPLDLQLAALPKEALVSDLIYIPLETPLLAAARERGNPTVNGLGMLLHQAVPAFEAYFGIRPQITDALRRAVLATFAT